MVNSPDRSRRFRFSLRRLFVLMTLLGVALGWLGMQWKWIQDRHNALRWILPLLARQRAAQAGEPLPPKRGIYLTNADSDVPWSLAILGERGVERLEVEEDWLGSENGYQVEELRRLFPESDRV